PEAEEAPPDPTQPAPPPPPPAPPAGPPAEGRWRLDVTATDDLGRTSTTRQQFTVNNTLGFVRLASSRIVVRPRGGQRLRAGVTLTRPARVTATVETMSGVRVATAAVRSLPAGRFTLAWAGTTNGGKSLVYSGRYVLRFRAVNELGAVELTSRPFTVIRAASPKPKPKPKPKPTGSTQPGD
ncbi:MAG TPA: FlgD immunoglobulin-like domain containing protein, partial [Gaiellaceae bacterium]|nr:FlgD immunoglobulin-like domain containing protein [Gaiellaceae bacterium]